jgi:hypothetical protein
MKKIRNIKTVVRPYKNDVYRLFEYKRYISNASNATNSIKASCLKVIFNQVYILKIKQTKRTLINEYIHIPHHPSFTYSFISSSSFIFSHTHMCII